MPDQTHEQFDASELDIEHSFTADAARMPPANADEMRSRGLAVANRLAAVCNSAREHPKVVLNALLTVYLSVGEAAGLQSECASVLLTTGFATALKSAPASVLGGRVH